MPEQLPDILKGLEPKDMATAMMAFQRMTVEFGTTLMEEGDEDASLICILDGDVEIKTGKVELGRAGPGQLIGEMALFGDGLRLATVKTVGDCTFLALDRQGYETLRDAGNPVARNLEEQAFQSLATRLRDVNKRIGKIAEGSTGKEITPDAGVFRKLARLFGGGGGRGFAMGLDALATLKKSKLFANQPEAALADLAAKFSRASFSRGTFICQQGDRGDEMFILAEGLVEVVMALDETRVEPLATLDPGDAFGMASLIEDNSVRMASCVAKDGVRCLCLSQDAFDELMDSDEPAGSAMRVAVIRSLIDQVAYANGQLALLDIERRQKTGELKPLMRAKGGLEAHGRHLKEKAEE